MNEVVLHGELLERYGEIPPLNVRDPAEAIRALACQLPDFGNVIRHGEWYVIVEDDTGKYSIPTEALTFATVNSRIHIVPAVEGAASQKKKGGVKVALGALVTGIGVVTGQGWLAAAGVSMMFGGAALILSPQPKMPSSDQADEKNSFIFNGTSNPSGQNFSVPCVWGRHRVGAMPVATRIVTDQISIPGAGGPYVNYPYGYDPLMGIFPDEYMQNYVAKFT